MGVKLGSTGNSNLEQNTCQGQMARVARATVNQRTTMSMAAGTATNFRELAL